jgi:hypothetical protein
MRADRQLWVREVSVRTFGSTKDLASPEEFIPDANLGEAVRG